MISEKVRISLGAFSKIDRFTSLSGGFCLFFARKLEEIAGFWARFLILFGDWSSSLLGWIVFASKEN
jgi:hypothetical protein